MSTITAAHFAFPLQWSKDHLDNVQKKFNKDPNAIHWNICIKAMLTHQQLTYAVKSTKVDKDKLFRELEESPIGYWQDVICLNTLGLFCADAVNRT
jgi:hypothetical protein